MDIRYCTEQAPIPVVDLSTHLAGEDATENCKAVADCLHRYGVLVVRDPRVHESDNDRFLDTMEKYYISASKKLYAGETLSDAHPELYYQVGVTPENVERARNHCDRADGLEGANKPMTECPPHPDAKWRFFWRIGSRPTETKFPSLQAEDVIPEGFPDWSEVMNRWGNLMLASLKTVAEMAAVGFGLAANTFTDLLHNGPHLLAPTGSDLVKYGTLGTVFAGYHYDLNFMTIHGRSRFPGLYIWTREGQKVLVKVPPGCLILQAGKQFEWLTGGEVLAGFHEVIFSPETQEALQRAKDADRPLWRISSTLFGHVACDQTLQPLAPFASAERNEKYPPTLAGDQVQEELRAIALA
eukprot:GILK01000011.1.p2 GENE.GILK01000011.1~~GILK01000011.1.p2  ORF type:complete len:355 (-),score=78.08 GILK01000011.1:206-1270(-)